jgi:hypothetical protein
MRIIRTKIGYVRGDKGDKGDQGPPWEGSQILIDLVDNLDKSVNARVVNLESTVDEKMQIVDSIYIRKDARGSINGVAELDSNGVIPEYRLPDYLAWVGGEWKVYFENLVGKIITSGVYNQEEGWLEC